jgi:hypothetical protein
MVESHLLDGDGAGNKLVAEVEGNYVTFINITVEAAGRVKRHSFARVRIGRLLALAEVLKGSGH